MLSIVLIPGTRKDDSANNCANQPCTTNQRTPKKKKRVVGVYRHKSVLQCTTGFIAMSLIVRLHHANDLSFIQPQDTNKKPGWQKVHVMENWKNNDSGKRACHKAYTTIMEQLGIHWHKVTHLRSSGMGHASKEGLNADQLATLSKHRGEQIFDLYVTELFPDVMHVMSGNKPNGTWFVEHTEVELGYSLMECINWLFPHYNQWVTERESENGDHHQSSFNFLYDLIPFLTYVAVQDAPYWLKHFPQHEYSIFLPVKCLLSL